jgi:DNA-binding transcriptional MerR regulator
VSLLSTVEAATCARVEPGVVRTWAHRGLLQPVDRDARGRPLYRLSDVVAVERSTRLGAWGRTSGRDRRLIREALAEMGEAS